ncbi:hypothetical protein [Luteimonas sp. TWI1416]|uniref:hypothetical protein n=1 Tax=unclassified Luteimonas TaxID=2629088 RepID=UPI003209BD7F
MSGIEFSYALTMNHFNSEVKDTEAVNKGSSAATGSWLVALATMLGKMADRLGDGIVKQAKLIDQQMNKEAEARNGGKTVEDSNLSQLNSEMQAMSQQMKMLMDAISTIIKSIGEGNSSIARKQ